MARANTFNEFQSRMRRGERIEYFVNKAGSTTLNVPNVQVSHVGNGRVDIVANDANGGNPWSTTLESPDADELKDVIATGREKI